MMNHLSDKTRQSDDWSWAQFEPDFIELQECRLTEENVENWLKDWTRVTQWVSEVETRLRVATTQDTTDAEADRRFRSFLDEVAPKHKAAQQQLKEKLLASGLQPSGMAIPLRSMRTQAALFRETNLPLMIAEDKLKLEYSRTVGTQTVEWEGEERTLIQLRSMAQNLDRESRERAWRLGVQRQLQDRAAINDLWKQFMDVRRRIAANAGYVDYRAYRWLELNRFDYTPADCQAFHEAIEKVVVPAATRVYERQRRLLGVQSLRPWDLDRDDIYPPARPRIHAYHTIEELESKAEAIFQRVDPQLGEYFGIMRREKLLDLGNRKGKGPGGYCTYFPQSRRPFIFMNAVGVESDVRTLLHEAGHCFHAFEASRLPYEQQQDYPIEFAEVASMAMELLTAPYWAASEGGYYSDTDVIHARRSHLENILIFWPYMAVVDAFQHWVYTHHDDASDPANCDARWAELWDRFIPGVDWSGLEEEKRTGWHRKQHIHRSPFYYVDYGLAQLGAVQIWRGAQDDQAGAVARYRRGLALGATAALPDLFAAAGAKFAFDFDTVSDAVSLIETSLTELSTQ